MTRALTDFMATLHKNGTGMFRINDMKNLLRGFKIAYYITVQCTLSGNTCQIPYVFNFTNFIAKT